MDVIIIGSGGHAKVVAEIVLRNGDNVVGFLTCDQTNKEVIGLPVLGRESDYDKFLNCHFIVAIGDVNARERISSNMINVRWYTAIHPDAILSGIGTTIGEGTVVMASTVINPSAQIGSHCIINTAALVEHDNVVSDYVHIAIGAKLAGTVSVGKRTLIGAGATISDHVSICDDCVIGAGTVVVKNIIEPGTYVGVPAKKIK